MAIRILLLALCLLALPVAAAPDAALPRIAAADNAASPESSFDSKAALKISQAAIDNQVHDGRYMTSTGELFSLSKLRGKPLVLSLVYTSCFHTCPMTIQNLAKVVRKATDAVGEGTFNVAIVGFDVDNDTPAAMRYFGRKQGVDDKGWYLLSADQPTIKALIQDVGFLYTPSPRGFDHLIQTTVIDGQGKIYRQIYGEVFDTQHLVEPLMDLVLDRPKGRALVDELVDRVRLFCTTYDPRTDTYKFDYSLFLSMLIGASVIVSGFAFIIIETRKRNRMRRS